MVDKIWYNMEELIGGSEERVLIETYWNVKIILSGMSGSVMKVLIETYWNVKKIWSATLEVTASGINRNILECKGLSTRATSRQDRVLIETYWNVKFFISLQEHHTILY